MRKPFQTTNLGAKQRGPRRLQGAVSVFVIPRLWGYSSYSDLERTVFTPFMVTQTAPIPFRTSAKICTVAAQPFPPLCCGYCGMYLGVCHLRGGAWGLGHCRGRGGFWCSRGFWCRCRFLHFYSVAGVLVSGHRSLYTATRPPLNGWGLELGL